MEADYSDDNHTQGSLCSSTAMATYADHPPPSTRGQSQSPGSSGVPYAPYTLTFYHSDKVLAAGNQVDPRRGSHHKLVQGQATSLGFDAIRDQSTVIPTFIEDLGGRYLQRSNHEPTKPPSVVPESEDLGSDTGDSKSESESDAEHLQDLGDRWEYRRIVARRIGSTGRREALLEWEPTWEVEEEVGDLKRALRRYAKERRESQNPAEKACPSCGAKKRKYHA